jgi:hypothetical protein
VTAYPADRIVDTVRQNAIGVEYGLPACTATSAPGASARVSNA